VAKVIRSEESVEVYVSADNQRLNGLITRAQRRDTDAVDAIKDFYLEHISYYAMLASIDLERARPREDREGPDSQSADPDQERELQRACDTVCGIADDVFETLVTRAVDTVPAREEAASADRDDAVASLEAE
jgi:hypothetical protein